MPVFDEVRRASPASDGFIPNTWISDFLFRTALSMDLTLRYVELETKLYAEAKYLGKLLCYKICYIVVVCVAI